MATFILVMSNITILLIGYIIIDYRLKKRYINEEILNQIKRDISEMMRQMNEITERNVDLVQTSRSELNRMVNDKENQVNEMLLGIEKKIRNIDERMKLLKQNTPQQWLEMSNSIATDMITEDLSPDSESVNITETYKYSDFLNKKRIAVNAKKQAEEEEKAKQKELEDTLSNMEISDQVIYLDKLGKSHSEIKKILNLSNDEIEWSLNLYEMRHH